MTSSPALSRNDPCPCGSGQKYKKCCLGKATITPAPATPVFRSASELPPPSRNPDDLPSLIEYVVFHGQHGNFLEAARVCKYLLEYYPDNGLIYYHTARIMFLSGEVRSSLQLLKRAIQLAPDEALHYELLARIFLNTQQPEEAYKAISHAVKLNPDAPEFLYLQSKILRQSVREEMQEKGRQILWSLLDRFPRFFAAYESLFQLLSEQQKFDEADKIYAQLLEQDPPLEVLIPFLLMAPRIYTSRQDIMRYRTRMEENLDRLRKHPPVESNPFFIARNTTIFSLAYHGMNNRPLLEKISATYRMLFPSLNMVAGFTGSWTPPKNTSSRKKRIGFLSSFFKKQHVVMEGLGFFIKSVAEDPSFEVVIFDVGGSGMQVDLLKQLPLRHVMLPSSLSATTYQLISEQECDMLVYLDIGMDLYTYLLAYARLAPVQIALTGHPITTGVSTIDYYISSTLWEAPNAAEYYTEKLILMEHPLAYLEKPDLPSASYSKKELGFPEEGRLYACPATLYKIHPDFYGAVTELLQRDKEAIVLFFNAGNIDWKTVHNHFGTIAPEESARIRFINWLPKEAFMAGMALCDAILDPFHFGLSTTLYQIFAVGAPVVTWTGEFVHGRVATGLYRLMGIEGLTAESVSDYVDIAIRLASDKSWHASLREQILANNHKIYGDTGGGKEFPQVLTRLIMQQQPTS